MNTTNGRCYRTNTIRIQFGSNDDKPNDKEMFSFASEMGLLYTDVHTLAQDVQEKCIYIKFHTEDKYKDFLQLHDNVEFKYENGNVTSVKILPATGKLKYIRIFNLPTDITDIEIVEVLKKYGKIVSMKREKYAISTGWPVFSGVRGAYMELTEEIPQNIHFEQFKGRIYYDGQKEKCFRCGEENHQRVNCPIISNRLQQKPQQISSPRNFSSVVSQDSKQPEISIIKKGESSNSTQDKLINLKEYLRNEKQLEESMVIDQVTEISTRRPRTETSPLKAQKKPRTDNIPIEQYNVGKTNTEVPQPNNSNNDLFDNKEEDGIEEINIQK